MNKLFEKRKEIWADVPGFSHYEISSLGKVRHKDGITIFPKGDRMIVTIYQGDKKLALPLKSIYRQAFGIDPKKRFDIAEMHAVLMDKREGEVVWKEIADYPNYEISSKGEVRNKKSGRILRQFGKYSTVLLSKDGVERSFRVKTLYRKVFNIDPYKRFNIGEIAIESSEMKHEEWRPVKGFDGLYEVSNLGRVRSLNYHRSGKAKILKPECKCGYLRVDLHKEGNGVKRTVHSIVAEAFLGPRPKGLDINHLDENKENNRVENLEYCSRKANINHGTRNARVAATMTNGKTSKPVLQYDLNGNIVKRWPSVSEIERQLGYSQGHISECCLGKRKTAYHSIWKYE